MHRLLSTIAFIAHNFRIQGLVWHLTLWSSIIGLCPCDIVDNIVIKLTNGGLDPNRGKSFECDPIKIISYEVYQILS